NTPSSKPRLIHSLWPSMNWPALALLSEKRSSTMNMTPPDLLDCRERALQRAAVHALQGRGKQLLHLGHFLCASRLALGAERRHFRAHRTAVARVLDARHETLRLEPVHELGDVGPHAGHPLRALAQCERFARLRE